MAHDSARINEIFIVSPEISGQDEPRQTTIALNKKTRQQQQP